jgi:imidazolonepropionase-like amidohydrolase
MTGRGELGTIEVGHRADLLLVGDNPLENVAHIRKLRGVMAAGRWIDQRTLQEMITCGASGNSGDLQ